jgi:hypothetical protein
VAVDIAGSERVRNVELHRNQGFGYPMAAILREVKNIKKAI